MTSSSKPKFSEAEQAALDWLVYEGGSMLVSKITDRNEVDGVFRNITPGMPVFRKLEKRGFLYFTEAEELELDDGSFFQFTPEVYLVTDPSGCYKFQSFLDV